MYPQSPKTKLTYSDITSIVDGQVLGDMIQVWKDTAVSDSRLNMIAELKNKNIGFNEIEQFGLGLKYAFKSEKLQETSNKHIEKVIQAAMQVKMKDEIHNNKELKKLKTKMKRRVAEQHHPQTKQYKKLMTYLKQEAEKTRQIQKRKYNQKIRHLETRYREENNKDTAIPPGMEKYDNLRVFSKDRYGEIEKDEVKIHTIGELH